MQWLRFSQNFSQMISPNWIRWRKLMRTQDRVYSSLWTVFVLSLMCDIARTGNVSVVWLHRIKAWENCLHEVCSRAWPPMLGRGEGGGERDVKINKLLWNPCEIMPAIHWLLCVGGYFPRHGTGLVWVALWQIHRHNTGNTTPCNHIWNMTWKWWAPFGMKGLCKVAGSGYFVISPLCICRTAGNNPCFVHCTSSLGVGARLTARAAQ